MHSKSRRLSTLNHYHTNKSTVLNQKKWNKGKSILWSAAILLIGILLVVAFYYLDRDNQISNAIQSSGAFGVALSILLMALFCIIPVPSEFLMIMNMKVFGVWWGIFYTWIGAMLGAVAVFFLARFVGGHLLQAFVPQERLNQVNQWIGKKGALGLLAARLVPLPFIVVNYGAGVLKSVNTWDYIWTTGVGLLPYDIGAALVFLGFSTRFTIWIAVGGFAVVTLWVAGYLFNRRANSARLR